MMNNKGYALITTLVMSVVALGFISTLIYFVMSGSKATQSVRNYRSSLDIAKGATDFVTAGIYENQVGCADSLSAVQTFMDKYLTESPDYTISLLNYECEPFDTGQKEIYIVRLQVQRKDTNEKTIIEFGYLEEYQD